MGRPRKVIPEEVEDLVTASREVYEEFDIDDFLQELDDTSAQVYIWRIDQKNGEKEFIAKVGLDAVRGGMHEYLRDTYGPGKFRLSLRSSASGKYLKSSTVRIADMYPPGAALNGGGGDVATQRMHELTMAVIQGAIAKPAPPIPDLGNLLAGIAAMTPKFDMVQMMTALAGMMTAVKNMSSTDDPMKPVRETMQLLSNSKDLFGGNGGGELSTLGVIKDLGEKVIEGFQPVLNRQALPVVSGQQPQHLVMPAPETPQPAGAEQMTVRDWISAQLAFLKQKAAQGKDVDAWVDYLLDNQEEPGCRAICGAVEQGVTFEQVLAFDPEIAQNPAYVSWFRILFDGLREELLPPVDTTGKPGNGNNAGSHAEPGNPGVTPIPGSKPSV